MNFDAFKQKCRNKQDVEKYRNKFGTLLDLNGEVAATTVGFYFALDTAGAVAEVHAMIQRFQPTTLWVGTEAMQQQLQEMGYAAVLFPFFEGGGFMVVLKVPAVVMHEAGSTSADLVT